MRSVDRILGLLLTFFKHLSEGERYNPESGVWFEVAGRDLYRYHCETYSANVYVEMQTSEVDFVIYKSGTTEWLPPHDAEPMTEEQADKIMLCMIKYMQHFGYTFKIRI
jgi:hypothetical protein